MDYGYSTFAWADIKTNLQLALAMLWSYLTWISTTPKPYCVSTLMLLCWKTGYGTCPAAEWEQFFWVSFFGFLWVLIFFFLFNFMEQSSNFLPYSPKRIAFESAKSRLFSQICILLFVCVSLSIMYFCSRTCHNLFPHFCNCLRKSDLPPLLPTAYLPNLLLESQILKH